MLRAIVRGIVVLVVGFSVLSVFSPTEARAQAAAPGGNSLLTISAVGTAFGAALTTVVIASNAEEEKQAARLTLARGTGSFATDLAAHLRLSDADVPRVGAALRGARWELLPLLDNMKPGGGVAFIAAAQDVIRRDAVLGPRLIGLANGEEPPGIRPSNSLRR